MERNWITNTDIWPWIQTSLGFTFGLTKNITLCSKANMNYIFVTSNPGMYFWVVWANGDIHFEATVAEISYLQLNLGMEV